MRKDLDRFFGPASIAIVGASSDFGTISGQPLKHLTGQRYAGRIYPINPKHPELLGVKCWPSVAALPEVPDLALVMVGAQRVSRALTDVGEKGIPYAIIFASGYAELGAEGRRLQAEIVDIARRYDIGVVGPNCQGMMSIVNNVYGGFGSVFGQQFPVGPVSMVSQSGGFGFTVMALAANDGGLGHRHVVTTGNESGVSTLDFMDYFVSDPGTKLIVSYVEGFKDAHRLVEIGARALAAEKPVLVWKVGNSEEGQRAAASHTANLGGAMALYQAGFRQTGILQVEDIADVVDLGHGFLSGMRPRGNRVAILTISGGAGILMTDECVAGGLALAKLSEASTARLRKVAPSFAALGNPIDVTAAIFDNTDLVREAMEIILADPGVDSLGICNVSLQGDIGLKVAQEIVAVRATTEKPIFLAWSARDAIGKPFYDLLDAAKIPRFKSPMRCGRALATVTRYWANVDRMRAGAAAKPVVIASESARRMLAGKHGDIAEHEAKRVLAQYGIGITQESLAQDADDAAQIAARIGFPVVLKIQSADIPHKTEAGGVRLGLASEAAVRTAFAEIVRNATAYRADARVDGVLVQEMVPGGTEVILGVNNDPLFGPAVMVGLGGIFAEVLKDVVFRLAPVTRPMAEEMIRELRGFKALDGARGKPKADIAALADAIERLSALAVDLRDTVAELDVNPLFVFEAGKGVKAGDALIRVRGA
jgi:acyl-CoA synthetase (NDP forming)